MVPVTTANLSFIPGRRLRKKKKLLMQQKHNFVTIDLQNIIQSDNSGLVLLVAWIRDAHAQGKSINYCHVPEFMRGMAQVFGLESILFNHS